MDKFKAIETFISVCDEGSFTKAADRLSISVAMVSKSISQLEAELKLKLLNRNTRKQTLTEAGELYLKSCRNILSELSAVEQELNHQSTDADGLIRVCAPTNYGTYELCPLIHQFNLHYPEIQIALTLSDELSDIIDDKFDFYFRVGQLADSGFISMRVDEQVMVFCASPQYLEEYGTPRCLDDLAKHKVLAFSPWGTSSSFADHYNIKPLNLSSAPVSCNNGNSLRMLAKLGTGIILQPQALVAEDIANKDLIQILEAEQRMVRPIFMVYLNRDLLPARVKLFIEFVKHYKVRPITLSK
ncbi:LysR family transcriptional regulator [Vibrio superstes]|uniref:Transcriptional regulator n=1 Tax=Vibrio superstes NBRC 103154 TaxID=1219062 RepID=A0A511QRV1_9VIBR|nr:LysR family transcriptional regulator [Vibrio superstes]GEM80079.1 transcriptional regulator [Vibrio superstes NBRC 103154]